MSHLHSTARKRMIDHQLWQRGIRDPRILKAFEAVPRHLFVPTAVRAAAYDDCALPLGHGQTISQPYMVALMTSALEVSPGERVLEIGTGSGFQACILAQLVREVHTIELIPGLSNRAKRLLDRLKIRNVVFHVADGSMGWPEAAPYDGIMVTAAAPALPQPLLGQLGAKGRLIIPVEVAPGSHVLKQFSRSGKNVLERSLASVVFVPLRGRYGFPRQDEPYHGAELG